jgi:hypothetical protein
MIYVRLGWIRGSLHKLYVRAELPRGTGFSQLPSVVISIIDHP